MSKNSLAVCISILLTALTCSVGSRLLWGGDAGQIFFGFLLIGFPVVIILFALFYSLADKIVSKYEPKLTNKNGGKTSSQDWPKILSFIGYVEVVTGVLGCAILMFLLATSNGNLVSNALSFLITIFIFISGYLLLNRQPIGFYLSLISQFLTFVSFTSDTFSYSLSSVLKFYITLNFMGFSVGLNFVSLIFAVLLIKNRKKFAQPVT